MPTITREEADQLARRLEDNFREDYSGRGMFGETCIGFTVDNETDRVHLDEVLEDVLGGTRAEALRDSFTTDNMGLGHILYARGWTVEAAQYETFEVTVMETFKTRYLVKAVSERDAKRQIDEEAVYPEGRELAYIHAEHTWQVRKL